MAHPCKLSCLHRFALMYGKSLLVPRGPGQREAAVPLTPVPSLLRVSLQVSEAETSVQ